MNDQLHLAHSASDADRRHWQAYRSLAADSRWQPGTSLARGLFLARGSLQVRWGTQTLPSAAASVACTGNFGECPSHEGDGQ